MKSLRLPTLAFCLLLAACAKEPEDTPTEPKPRLVGRIASIPAGRDFVLIQAYGKWTVETGSVLTTQGADGRAANLLSTGEKLGQYAAADIRTGTLEVGDGVYTIVTTTTPEEETETAETEEESEPATGEKSD